MPFIGFSHLPQFSLGPNIKIGCFRSLISFHLYHLLKPFFFISKIPTRLENTVHIFLNDTLLSWSRLKLRFNVPPACYARDVESLSDCDSWRHTVSICPSLLTSVFNSCPDGVWFLLSLVIMSSPGCNFTGTVLRLAFEGEHPKQLHSIPWAG